MDRGVRWFWGTASPSFRSLRRLENGEGCVSRLGVDVTASEQSRRSCEQRSQDAEAGAAAAIVQRFYQINSVSHYLDEIIDPVARA